MSEFRKKPVVVDAITFEELVEYGRAHTTNIVRDMPWSFDYKGHPITHENDECYLIPTLEGTMKFNKGDMLITGVKGEIYPCKPDIFAQTYEPAVAQAQSDGACTTCNGHGKVQDYKYGMGWGAMVTCRTCNGTGNKPTPATSTLVSELQSIIIEVHFNSSLLPVEGHNGAPAVCSHNVCRKLAVLIKSVETK